jgi:GNAT superfamily N-acetyltransferase
MDSMMERVRDMSAESLLRAIEDNTADFLLALGRAGGGEERKDRHVHWTIGGSPIDYHNSVVRADLSDINADRVISESIEVMRARQVPGTWHVGPSMRPKDIGDRLVRHGFTYGGNDIGMAIDLRRLPQAVPEPPGLTVTRVRDHQDLAVWARTLAEGFGEGEREAAWVGVMYVRIGLGDAVPWRHYLGTRAGEPVATVSLFLGAGVAGIYFVFTVPRVRRRGIGAAMTLAALNEARAMGFQIGVLGSSPMGYSVYRGLGFQERCRIPIYEWRPPD